MLLSLIRSRFLPQEVNYEVKARREINATEIVELSYERIHGSRPNRASKIGYTIFFSFWFSLSLVLVIVGIGIFFLLFGLRALDDLLTTFNQVETYYVSEEELIREKIAFGQVAEDRWRLRRIRKLLVGLDVEVYEQSTARNYKLTMVINRGDQAPAIGEFDTVDILEVGIEPRQIELCLEVALRFESHGLKVERLVQLVQIESNSRVCRSCSTVNYEDDRYCRHCGEPFEVRK